ncbi:hypothetical protein [Kineosporia babensis]|uniref:Uncharacterized protein n=1 Tax=Kineosporia babensis TaxID=499548 RepID=A0A9X1NMF1_9ACTN|nr:hypothetical protein [Kineosporia babensis]MCD5317055.1 hypothetical protein [Kineosporia babensis]
MADKRTIDEANFHLALQSIRERFPTGIRATFESSDQGFYGFWLREVQDAEGRNVFNAAEPHDWQEYLDDLDWDGVMQEDEHGRAEILLSAIRGEGDIDA